MDPARLLQVPYGPRFADGVRQEPSVERRTFMAMIAGGLLATWGHAIGSLESANTTFGSVGSVAQGGSDGGFIVFGGHRRAQREADRLFDACMEARGWQ